MHEQSEATQRNERAMRLSQRDQILILDAIHLHPGPLAEWMRLWVAKQQEMGSNGSWDLGSIEVPPAPVNLDAISSPLQVTRKEELAEHARLRESVGYESLPKHQRKAINKYMAAQVDVVEETSRQPDTETCWLGDHPMEGWDEDDFYLWCVIGKWSSSKDLRKWGCEDCARLIFRTHPRAKLSAYSE